MLHGNLELRGSFRFKKKFNAKITDFFAIKDVVKNTNSLNFIGRDISHNGVCIRAVNVPKNFSNSFVHGRQLSLSLCLSNQIRNVILPGRIVWVKSILGKRSKDVEIGLKFSNMDKKHQAIFKNFIKAELGRVKFSLKGDLKNIVISILGANKVRSFSYTKNIYKDLGVDSFSALEILVASELKYGIKLDQSDLLNIQNFNDLVRLIKKSIDKRNE